jgi:hypothetical protein
MMLIHASAKWSALIQVKLVMLIFGSGMSQMGHLRTNRPQTKIQLCPLLSESGHSRVRLICPLSAKSRRTDHCVVVWLIEIGSRTLPGAVGA